MSKNGETVRAFEEAFASYVGAKYAIALCNGTATLHTALVALGVKPGDKVAVPPLTMSSTTLAVLHAGAVPVFVDVDERMWLMQIPPEGIRFCVPVSLYGLSGLWGGNGIIDDAAQTLKCHDAAVAFTSYSFQASKILALGEGGMLVTNDEALAVAAREFSSLGYRMRADQPRIDSAVLKSSTYERHHSIGYNYRMNDLTASKGLAQLEVEEESLSSGVTDSLGVRAKSAARYREAIQGCDWIVPQHVPEGWRHDMWAFAVACDTPERANQLSASVVKYKGERPYGCWRLAYQEPALRHLDPRGACTTCGRMKREGRFEACPDCLIPAPSCPVAESLQPRILQMQTNSFASAEQNATALRRAIEEMSA